MGKQPRIKAKRRGLRQYVETRAITPTEANEAMRRVKGRLIVIDESKSFSAEQIRFLKESM